MSGTTTRLVAAITLACMMTPVAAQAGTRASETKVVPVSKSGSSKGQGYYSPGPKDGFKDNKGREIANIKADDHAAFKRNKSNGC